LDLTYCVLYNLGYDNLEKCGIGDASQKRHRFRRILLRGFLRAREQSLEKRDEADKRSINVHLRPEVYGSYHGSVSPTSFHFAGSIPSCIMMSARPEPIIAGYPKGERIVVFYSGEESQVTASVFARIHIHVGCGGGYTFRDYITRNPLLR